MEDSDLITGMMGHCLFCLIKLEPTWMAWSKLSSNSFQHLAHYLRLDVSRIFDKTEMGHDERSKLKVPLCAGCDLLSEKIWGLYEQLEKIKLELATCLNNVQGKIGAAEENGLVLMFRKSYELLAPTGEESDEVVRNRKTELLKAVDALRQEVTQKCSRKLSSFPPQVEVADIMGQQTNTEDCQFNLDSVSYDNDDPDYLPPPLSPSSNELYNGGINDLIPPPLQTISEPESAEALPASAPVRTHIHHCQICGKGFNEPYRMRRHIKSVHVKSKDFKCNHCEKAFPLECSLRKHMRKVHSELTSNQEVQVRQTSSDASTLLITYSSEAVERLGPPKSTINPETGKHKCSLCPKEFKDIQSFRGHYKGTHLNYRYKCTLCENKEFVSQHDYRRHHVIEHLEETNLKCHKCNRTFTQKSSLRDHQQLMLCEAGRGRGIRFRCTECGKGCRTEKHLESHVRRVHLKLREYVCHHCGKGFTSNRNMGKHITEVHSRAEEYVCDLCAKVFYRKDSLTRHMRAVHHVQL